MGRHRSEQTKVTKARREQRAGFAGSAAVSIYFFDTRDNDVFIEDDVGTELNDLEEVKAVAAVSLTELARDVLPGSMQRDLAVEVRDERQPVLQAKLRFEAIVLVEVSG